MITIYDIQIDIGCVDDFQVFALVNTFDCSRLKRMSLGVANL
jgi:hypothetical protein